MGRACGLVNDETMALSHYSQSVEQGDTRRRKEDREKGKAAAAAAAATTARHPGLLFAKLPALSVSQPVRAFTTATAGLSRTARFARGGSARTCCM